MLREKIKIRIHTWLSLNGVDWELYSNSPVRTSVAVGAVHHDPNDQSQPFKLWGLKKIQTWNYLFSFS